MQGRLGPPTDGRFQCFPRDGWRDEFERAARAGLGSIEWIYDVHGADVNPLATSTGVAEIRGLAERHSVAIRSLCADYFMDRPLLRTDATGRHELLTTLAWLIDRCRDAGIGHIVLPFVDASRIETEDEAALVVGMLRPALEVAERASVELHLETSLPPRQFAELLQRLPHRMLRANYDSGNSASLGYAPRDEFDAYGPRIGSIHIKDRVRGGGTVPLGTGNADFPALFESIAGVGYRGDFILQVARGEPGDEIDWSARSLDWLGERLKPAGLVAKEVPR
jgi:hexulose-6-phosphate isomerase